MIEGGAHLRVEYGMYTARCKINDGRVFSATSAEQRWAVLRLWEMLDEAGIPRPYNFILSKGPQGDTTANSEEV